MSNERLRLSDLKARDALAIVAGWLVLLVSVAQLLIGSGDLASRGSMSWALWVVAVALVTIAGLRAAFWLTASKRPAAWVWFLSIVVGAALIVAANYSLQWRYPRWDLSLQPVFGLASVLFFAFFGAYFLILGVVLTVSSLLGRLPPAE
jgi:hypothetical protein